jgi:23S rRNA (cytosine1962-C5)-methyltransferase
MATTVKVTKRGAERARARNLWIYVSDVADTNGARGGEVVRVTDGRGHVLGRALYSSRSQIALRFVSFDDEENDRDFWAARLRSAQELRDQVVRDATAYRLVYGESDLLGSLIIDRFNDCFVIQTLSQGTDALKQMWVDLLVESYGPRAIIERNEARVRELEGLPRVAGVLYGSDPGNIVIEEGGVRFSVNLLEGQKTGAFLDQRENRVSSQAYARGRALDCFTFAGGFALHLARRADRVTAVDISSQAIAQARGNAELNGATNTDFIEANVFDYLHEVEQAGEKFDVINLDPPAFAKNRSAVEAAMRGYKEINLRAMRLLAPGGRLATFSCSFHVDEATFEGTCRDAATDAGVHLRILERLGQAPDHPTLLTVPETRYLNGLLLAVG